MRRKAKEAEKTCKVSLYYPAEVGENQLQQIVNSYISNIAVNKPRF